MNRAESPARAISLREILAVAVILGVLGGLLEGASHFVRARFLDTNLPLGAYMVWMPAAANLAFFLGLAVLVALLRMVAPRRLSPPGVVGLFTALAAMAALRAFDNYVSILTVDLVAIGLAVQAARWAGPRWDGMRHRLVTVAGLSHPRIVSVFGFDLTTDGIAYLAMAWFLLQLADLVLENINAPDWVMQAVI